MKKILMFGLLAISSFGFAGSAADISRLTEAQKEAVIKEYFQRKAEKADLARAEINKALDEAKSKHKPTWTGSEVLFAAAAAAMVGTPVGLCTFGVVALLDITNRYHNTIEDQNVLEAAYKKSPDYRNFSDKNIEYFAQKDAVARNRGLFMTEWF